MGTEHLRDDRGIIEEYIITRQPYTLPKFDNRDSLGSHAKFEQNGYRYGKEEQFGNKVEPEDNPNCQILDEACDLQEPKFVQSFELENTLWNSWEIRNNYKDNCRPGEGIFVFL